VRITAQVVTHVVHTVSAKLTDSRRRHSARPYLDAKGGPGDDVAVRFLKGRPRDAVGLVEGYFHLHRQDAELALVRLDGLEKLVPLLKDAIALQNKADVDLSRVTNQRHGQRTPLSSFALGM